jgi:hypothetical protein
MDPISLSAPHFAKAIDPRSVDPGCPSLDGAE